MPQIKDNSNGRLSRRLTLANNQPIVPRRMGPVNVPYRVAIPVIPDANRFALVTGLATGGRVDGELSANRFEGRFEVFAFGPNDRVSRNVNGLRDLIDTKWKPRHQHRRFCRNFPSVLR